MPQTYPTLIFVPGAYHLPDAYVPLVKILESASYRVIPVRTPSVGASLAHTSADQDIQAVRAVILEAVGRGEDVVLVMHSYGGLVGGEACKGLSRDERRIQGLEGGVVHLFYMAGFPLQMGKHVLDLYLEMGFESMGTAVGSNKDQAIVKDPHHFLYNDLPAPLAESLASQLQTQSIGVFFSKATHEPWKHIPSTYLICELDNGLPLKGQEWLVGQEGAKFEVVRFRCGHSPFAAMRDETARAVRRAAGEVGF